MHVARQTARGLVWWRIALRTYQCAARGFGRDEALHVWRRDVQTYPVSNPSPCEWDPRDEAGGTRVGTHR